MRCRKERVQCLVGKFKLLIYISGLTRELCERRSTIPIPFGTILYGLDQVDVMKVGKQGVMNIFFSSFHAFAFSIVRVITMQDLLRLPIHKLQSGDCCSTIAGFEWPAVLIYNLSINLRLPAVNQTHGSEFRRQFPLYEESNSELEKFNAM